MIYKDNPEKFFVNFKVFLMVKIWMMYKENRKKFRNATRNAVKAIGTFWNVINPWPKTINKNVETCVDFDFSGEFSDLFLGVTPHKATDVRPYTIHHENYPN